MPRAAPPPSLAERYRAHRAEMQLAMELGITPKQARAELDRRAALERHRREQPAFLARMEARSGPVRRPPAQPLAESPRTTPDQTYAATQRLLGERD